jgi:WD40 repeat protein
MPTIAPLDLGEHSLFAGFVNDVPMFATVDGALHVLDGAHSKVDAHQGLAGVAITHDGKQLVTGGEDGKVALTGTDLVSQTLSTHGSKWIAQVASGPNGAISWAIGKTAYVRETKGQIHEITHARTVEGLAFFPKGLRIACAHYDGVSLHFPGTKSGTQMLPWKGAHLGVTVAPDGVYVISTMQENALHGWRLADKRDLRMSGYPAKTKSLSWSQKGRYLATSGAPAAIIWPFLAKDGPMGKAPLELGTRGDAMVIVVACHPQEDLVAIGYNDGMILLVRFSDAREVVLRRAGTSAISALGWDKTGARLAFGSENGNCGVVDLRG